MMHCDRSTSAHLGSRKCWLDKIPLKKTGDLKQASDIESLLCFHPSGRKTRPFEKQSLRIESPSIPTSAQAAKRPGKSDTSSLGALTKIYWGLERTLIVEEKGVKKKKNLGPWQASGKGIILPLSSLTFPRVAWKTPNKIGLAKATEVSVFVPEGRELLSCRLHRVETISTVQVFNLCAD